ncbi:MAG: hypothetical protein NVSMB25_12120 [Thermoleophilaceae bacterium]
MADMKNKRAPWLATGVLGLMVLVLFDSAGTLTAGVLLLLAFVAWGVFLIVTPDLLDGEP